MEVACCLKLLERGVDYERDLLRQWLVVWIRLPTFRNLTSQATPGQDC